MLQSLYSCLIKKYGFVNVYHFAREHMSLLEFFDRVLISGNKNTLCLFKKADGISQDELERVSTFGRHIFKNAHLRTCVKESALIFFVFEYGVECQIVEKILSFKAFKNSGFYKPVIVDAQKNKLIYKHFEIPVHLLLLLKKLFRHIKQKNSTEDECEKESKFEELKTLIKLESFRKTTRLGVPYVTYLLIIINLLVWLLMETWGSSTESATLIRYGAKIGPPIWEGEFWRLFTPSFVHIGFLHLFSNCVILYFAGSILEALTGSPRTAFIYVITGLCGNMLSLIFSPNLSAGASSSVFGILGALIYYVIKYKHDLPDNFYRIIILYLCPFVLYNLIIGGFYPNIDNYAHVGGIIAGMLAMSVLGVRYPANLPKKINIIMLGIFILYTSILFYFSYVPRDEAYSSRSEAAFQVTAAFRKSPVR